jgi:Spy/CpxP family protein refolding chaperone
MNHGAHQETMHFLHRELKLTAVQLEKLDEIRKGFFDATRRHLDEIHDLRQAMTQAALEENPNLDQIRQWSNRLGEIQAAMEFYRFKHFAEVRAICNPEQRIKLDLLLKDVLIRTDPHLENAHHLNHNPLIP